MSRFGRRIDAALELVDEEIARVDAERDAVRRFRRRIGALETRRPAGSATAPTPAGAIRSIGEGRSASPALDRVRTAYRETVMSAPHYEDEYGDTFEESVAAEFGAETAELLRTSDRFTDALRELLVRACRRSLSSVARSATRFDGSDGPSIRPASASRHSTGRASV
uniref:DUF7260 family protein n=1 Tax=Halegenticoccus soli TaxID=1985678 RepID=UPI000C6EFAFE|nr:hypothetical protein [Halegenticoccus soli]